MTAASLLEGPASLTQALSQRLGNRNPSTAVPSDTFLCGLWLQVLIELSMTVHLQPLPD